MVKSENYFYLYNLFHTERTTTINVFRDYIKQGKFCNKCNEYKNWDEFGKHKSGKYGLQPRCKSCLRHYNKKHYQKNKKDILKRNKKWQQENNYKGVSSQYYRERYNNDSNYKIYKTLQARINIAIQNEWKSESSSKLLGCTIKKLKQHLQNQFTDEMGWANYGEVWHIDHEIPCAKFDLTDPHQQAVCFHWSNLQPLLVKDNIIKNDKIKIFN